MKKIDRLKREARESAEWRGHQLKRFKKHGYQTKEAYALCRKCGRGAFVDSAPAPNGIKIFGEAVALNCK